MGFRLFNYLRKEFKEKKEKKKQERKKEKYGPLIAVLLLPSLNYTQIISIPAKKINLLFLVYAALISILLRKNRNK